MNTANNNSDDSNSSAIREAGIITAVASGKFLNVREYDREKHLYIADKVGLLINAGLLIFSTQDTKPIVVGYVLDGKITPLTDELKDIARNYDLPVSDTHFDEK